MLVSLSIKNLVLIDQLNLNCTNGVTALTGETGAGKSILLDALGLVLGMRGDAGLVRKGTDQATISAAFDVSPDHAIWPLLDEHGIAREDMIMLRRILGKDGRSRAFINDQPVSVGLLKTIGETLVEIHGQFETQGLLNTATHKTCLDLYGGYKTELDTVKQAHKTWKSAETKLADALSGIEKTKEEQDFLETAIDDLKTLDAEDGEEARLNDTRNILMNREKFIHALNTVQDVLDGEEGADTLIRRAQSAIDGIDVFSKLAETLDRAHAEIEEAVHEVSSLSGDLDHSDMDINEIEQRLFDLKNAARKYGCGVDELPAKLDQFQSEYDLVSGGTQSVDALTAARDQARATYIKAADDLSVKRKAAAQKLDTAVMTELPPLKLEKAKFETQILSTTEDETKWHADGFDNILFTVATNPGSPQGSLAKIASGGELARFMLALKVVLARISTVPVMVFDEVDSGISGATADAVGERLLHLGENVQILIVTHSPQVAARAHHHWVISKSSEGDITTTSVRVLERTERTEEIARMLSGTDITAEARAAAQSLMKAS